MSSLSTRNLIAMAICLTVSVPVVPQAAFAQQQTASQPVSNNAPSACSDWSKRTSFEEATAEYMRLASRENPDFGCLSKASWMAVEDAFQPQNINVYISRLKNFDATYRHEARQNPRAAKAIEDLKVLLQLRWLSINYESLKDYQSRKVTAGVAGATGALIGLGGAALLLHNPTLLNIRKTARPALVRMVKHLGTIAFARAAGNYLVSDGSKETLAQFALRPPPLDIIGRDTTFWNYSDLDLLRDVAAEMASAVTMGAIETTVAIVAMKYISHAATVGGLLSAPSLVGLAISYPVGQFVTNVIDKAITDAYHQRYAQETLKLSAELQKPVAQQTDWQRYNLGAELTRSGISWVASQDVALQQFIETKTTSFARFQICTRLRQQELKEFNDDRKIALMKREAALGRSFEPAASDGTSDQATQERFTNFFVNAEAHLRSEIKKELDEKHNRLLEVRAGIKARMQTLADLKKPYLDSFIVQHMALIDRLDRYLLEKPLIEDQILILREHAKSLSINSPKWKDQAYIKQLSKEHGCF